MLFTEKISDFLNSRPSYISPAGVRFNINPDASIFITANFAEPEPDNLISLDFFKEAVSMEELAQLRLLSKLDDVEQFKPQDLLNLFYNGKASVVCTLDGYFTKCLNFEKKQENLCATDDEGKMHIVKTQLDKPENFINYTLGYYLNSN